MRFLCVCQYGHSRSVCLTRVLHAKGYQAIAAGAHTSPDAIHWNAMWADHIVLLQPHFISAVPNGCRDKVVVFDVGPDRWSNPYNKELYDILTKHVEEKGW